MKVSAHTSTVAFFVLSAAACGSDTEGPSSTVGDSAGIRIVENRHPVWRKNEGWEVEPDPTLDIGTAQGEGPFQFSGVADAARQSDGHIVVLDAGSRQVRCFASDGRFLWAAGREGEGPAEFLTPVWLQGVEANGVAVYDFRLRRLSIVDASGTFLTSYQVPPEVNDESVTAVGLFDDGSVLLQSLGRPIRQGKYRDTLTYFRFEEDADVVATLGRFPGWEKFFWSQGTARGLADHPLGLGSFPVAHDDRFLLGLNDEYGFTDHTLDGVPLLIVHREHARLPVTSEDVDRYRDRQLQANPRFWQGLFPHITFPHTMPAYRRLLVDTEGAYWVEEYRRSGDAVPRWTVFASDGRWLGTVILPTGLRVFEIGADYVLGVWRDELDVEHVRLHEMRGRVG